MSFIKCLILLNCLLFASCANIKGISGGPDDKTAPSLIIEKSTPNFQRNFKNREINLFFDEWIRIDNPSGNITISPTLQYPPEFKLKGKKFSILLDKREILKENTTYSIQFGETIKDITLGNIQRKIRYIFSTGDYIDSLKIHGTISNALTAEKKDKIIVSLYENLDDTAFQKQKPHYFTWTDSSGNFLLENLKPGSYKIYALDDKNQNYYYDQLIESFAFMDQAIRIDKDTLYNYHLFLSTATPPYFIKDKIHRPGLIKIIFSEWPGEIKLESNKEDAFKKVQASDTLIIWNVKKDSITCFLQYGSNKDTLSISPDSDDLNNNSYKLSLINSFLKPDEWPHFLFPFPIEGVKLDSILIQDTSRLLTNVVLDTTDCRKFFLMGNFNAVKESHVVLLKGAVTGLHQFTNLQDTVRLNYLEKSSLSKLKVTIDSLHADSSYVFQLLNNGTVSLEKVFIARQPTHILSFQNIYPGNYRVRLIHDNNRNKRWDPGNFSKKQQAEPVWYFELPELRADWDIDVKLKP